MAASVVPTTPAQGFSVLFNAGQLALSKIRGPKRIVLDTFEVDCTLSESMSFDADVTEFEVEQGANISDHRRLKPVELSIAGLVSDTPLDRSLIEQETQLASGALGLAVDLARTAQSLLAGDAVVTSKAFETLLQLYELGSTKAPAFNPSGFPDGSFTIVTKYRTFEHMLVKSLRFQRDRGTGRALPFFATFKQIRTVETSTTVLQSPAIMQSPNPLGEKGTIEASPALKARTQSLLLQLDDATGGNLKKTFPAAPLELLRGP